MAATLTELLMPQVIMRVISRLKKGRGPLGSWLGFQPDNYDPESATLNGRATRNGGNSVRNVSYRIFDNSRVVAKARAPGTGPATVAPNPIGQAMVSVARYHQKITLLYEVLGNLAQVVGPNSQIDSGGQKYIDSQTGFLGGQFNSMVEMMAAGMMRDSLYFIQVGDDWMPNFAAPTGSQVGFQVNFQIPSGNKNQLNMLGAGNIILISWANIGAPILDNIMSIKAAYAQLSRYALSDVWINSTMWLNIIQNTQIRNVAGTSNSPFAMYEMDERYGGLGAAKYKAKLVGDESISWHFCDDTLALNTDIDPSYATAPTTASLAKLVPDNMAIFCTEPDPEWCELYMGGEHVIENPGMPAVLREGYYFWHEYITQPSAVELIGLLNCVPMLYVPKAIAPATVVFP